MNYTKLLLSHPEVNHSGIEHTVVFHALPDEAKNEIQNASTEAEKLELACIYGDQSEKIALMYKQIVTDPADRKKAGLPFPTIEAVENSFLSNCLSDDQRYELENAVTDQEKRQVVAKSILK